MNKRPGISEDTRRRVMEVVGRMNFAPSQSARSQILKSTQNIAVLFNMNSHPLEHLFQESLNKNILRYCAEREFNLVFAACLFEDDASPVTLPNILRSHGVDGVVSYGYVPISVITSLQDLELPYLLLDSHQLPNHCMSLHVDYYAASRLAMRYLIDQGHSSIAYIGSNFPPLYSQQTFEGYRSSLEEAGIVVPLGWIQMQSRDSDGEDSAGKQMQAILQSGKLPTAVFCAADIYAIGAIRAVKQAGLRVPEDVSILGIDDILISSYIDPPLSTVRIDTNRLAQHGCDMLFESIRLGKVLTAHEDFSDFTLIERKTVRPLQTEHS
ncbi:Ribose operon repressor [bioreactor metagenome]|uniref:Ribose operon repressor n=1 Tax=bioreactor metagenome TaxID=1076179 RepID=A0A645BZD9_9ZZZZ